MVVHTKLLSQKCYLDNAFGSGKYFQISHFLDLAGVFQENFGKSSFWGRHLFVDKASFAHGPPWTQGPPRRKLPGQKRAHWASYSARL